jgi:hypothetical protein
MLLPSQHSVTINPEANQVTLDTSKYKYLLGRALGIEESDNGSAAHEVLSSKLHSLAKKVNMDKQIGNALNELDLIHDYFSL